MYFLSNNTTNKNKNKEKLTKKNKKLSTSRIQKGGSGRFSGRKTLAFPSLEGVPVLYPDVPDIKLKYKFPSFESINTPENIDTINKSFPKNGKQLHEQFDFIKDFNKLLHEGQSIEIIDRLHKIKTILENIIIETYCMAPHFDICQKSIRDSKEQRDRVITKVSWLSSFYVALKECDNEIDKVNKSVSDKIKSRMSSKKNNK